MLPLLNLYLLQYRRRHSTLMSESQLVSLVAVVTLSWHWMLMLQSSCAAITAAAHLHYEVVPSLVAVAVTVAQVAKGVAAIAAWT